MAVFAAVVSMAPVGDGPSEIQGRSLAVEQRTPNAPAGGSIPSAPATPYLAPWVKETLNADAEMKETDAFLSSLHPGETTSPHLATVERATARAASLGGSLTEAEVIAVLREAGAPEEWIAPLVAISWCESKHSPHALGDGGNSIGQYQLWQGWARPMGYTVEDLYDPLKAAKTALYVREVRGRFGGNGGWSCATLNGIP